MKWERLGREGENSQRVTVPHDDNDDDSVWKIYAHY